MKIYNNPPIQAWERLCERPFIPKVDLQIKVEAIFNKVKTEGDIALLAYAKLYDKVELSSLKVDEVTLNTASSKVSDALKKAIKIASNNIQQFHAAQAQEESAIETTKGVWCWRKSVGIENVGLYIPGGSAPLLSTLLMLAIPAQIAGCKRIVLCSPAQSDGEIDPTILYIASSLGITEVYKIGGAQAIAAMAFGTSSIRKVDKIFGPGNQYVTQAKQLIQQNGIAIDLPAGPSEVLIIADADADPDFVAADLLSQAEHGTDSQVVLLSNSASMIEKVEQAIEKQVMVLPRLELIKKTLENSFAIVLDTIETCVVFSNTYAPEHLILAVENPKTYIQSIVNAGSVFLGKYSCESAGDYASGTNHTLPTNGAARSYSGVSLDSFVRKITFQKISKEGIQNLGESIEIMAEAEQLMAHKNAVTIRLNKINNE